MGSLELVVKDSLQYSNPAFEGKRESCIPGGIESRTCDWREMGDLSSCSELFAKLLKSDPVG